MQCILSPIWIYIYVCMCYQLVAIRLVVVHVGELCLYLDVLWDTNFFQRLFVEARHAQCCCKAQRRTWYGPLSDAAAKWSKMIFVERRSTAYTEMGDAHRRALNQKSEACNLGLLAVKACTVRHAKIGYDTMGHYLCHDTLHTSSDHESDESCYHPLDTGDKCSIDSFGTRNYPFDKPCENIHHMVSTSALFWSSKCICQPNICLHSHRNATCPQFVLEKWLVRRRRGRCDKAHSHILHCTKNDLFWLYNHCKTNNCILSLDRGLNEKMPSRSIISDQKDKALLSH